MSLFCIIQGPLITYGQGPNNTKLGFKASKSICRNVELLDQKKIDYIVVTWNPSNANEILEELSLKEKSIKYKTLEIPSFFDPDHRFKHHYLISKAFDFFQSEAYSKVLKIRSDQVLTHNILDYLISYNSDRLLVSELMHYNPFYMGDFIYCAKKEIFISFLESQTKKYNYVHPIIANDIGFKFFLSKSAYPLRLRIMILYLFAPKKVNKLWSDFIKNNICTLSENDWNHILWRDKKISEVIKSSNFYFTDADDWKNKVSPFTNIFTIINGLKILCKKSLKA